MRFKPNYIVIPLIAALLLQISHYIEYGTISLIGTIQVPPILEGHKFLIIFLSFIAFIIAGYIKSIPFLLFWNRFPRREIHFYPILSLFIISEFLSTAAIYFIKYGYDSIFFLVTLTYIISLLILMISLWKHKLKLAAIWTLIIIIAPIILIKRNEHKAHYTRSPEHQAALVRSK